VPVVFVTSPLPEHLYGPVAQAITEALVINLAVHDGKVQVFFRRSAQLAVDLHAVGDAVKSRRSLVGSLYEALTCHLPDAKDIRVSIEMFAPGHTAKGGHLRPSPPASTVPHAESAEQPA
jgi:hypothetical protein